jgi:hypothetical protein
VANHFSKQDYVSEALDNDSDTNFYELDDDQQWEDQDKKVLRQISEITPAENIQEAYFKDEEDSLVTFGYSGSIINTNATATSSVNKPTAKKNETRPRRENLHYLNLYFIIVVHQLQAKVIGKTPELPNTPPFLSTLSMGINLF